MKKRFLFNLGFIVFLTVLFSSCQYISTYSTAQFTDQAIEPLLSKKEGGITPSNFQSTDLLGNSVALFSVINNTAKIPKDAQIELKNYYQDNVKQAAFFDVFLDEHQVAARFAANRQIAQSNAIYLDSLTTVAVSDKDISNPLGKFLNTDNFLILQIDHWPCITCSNEDLMRMKLRLVDAPSGYIIWTAIVERNNLTEEERSNLIDISKALCKELTDTFHHRFKQKWHRKRFKSLALLGK